MPKILDAILYRRSCREFEDKPLSSQEVKLLLESALRSPSAEGQSTTQFIVVEDKDVLEKLSYMCDNGSEFLSQVPIAIVVLGSALLTDRWIEDASLSAGWLQLQAEHMYLSSCWVQAFGINTPAGQDCSEYVRQILDIPYQLEVLCIIGVGHSKEKQPPKEDTQLKWENIHIGKYSLSEE